MHPSQLLAAVDAQQTQRKSPNSRRRRRGSRRRSSAVADMAPEENEEEEEEKEHDMSSNAQPSAESDPFFMTVHHDHHKQRRRSSHTGSKARPKHKASISKRGQGEDESPALQSLVDIISEIKRLPSISITPDTNTDESPAVDKDSNVWKRVRRHSEPPQKMRQQHQNDHAVKKNGSVLKTISEQHQRFGEPIFTNSFLPLEEEELTDSENMDMLVSPLNNDNPYPPPNRTRSRSGKLSVLIRWGAQITNASAVPNTLVNQHNQNQDHSISSRKPLYPAHMSATEAAAAVRSRLLYSGMLRVDMQDSSEANVECEELDASIYIFGSKNRNRALDGDQVAVELVDVDEMLNEKLTKRQIRYTRRLSAMSLNGGQASSVTSNGGLSSIPEDNSILLDVGSEMAVRPKYCGRVVCVLERPKSMLFAG